MVKQLDLLNSFTNSNSIDLDNCIEKLKCGFKNELLTNSCLTDLEIPKDNLNVNKILSASKAVKKNHGNFPPVCIKKSEEIHEIFSGLIFHVNSYGEYGSQKNIKKLITCNGGILSYVLNKQCSFMVKTNTTVSSWKDKKADDLGIVIVSSKFIEDCVQEKKLVLSEKYELKQENKKFESGIIKVGNKKHDSSFVLRYPIHLSQVSPIVKSKLNQFSVLKWIAFSNVDKRCKIIVCIELHVSNDEVYEVAVYKQNGDQHQPTDFYSLPNVQQAIAIFEQISIQVRALQYTRVYNVPPTACSPVLIMQMTLTNHATSLDENVLSMVDRVWNECLKQVQTMVTQTLQTFSLQQIDEAESIIEQLRQSIKSRDAPIIEENGLLCNKLGQIMKLRSNPTFARIRDLVPLSELCRIIRDMLEISEATNFCATSASISKVNALRCDIQVVDKDSNEFRAIVEQFGIKIKIKNLFQVHRANEWLTFKGDINNECRLFHGSKPSNVAGILSRGLMPPTVVTDQWDIDLTDIGHLGKGIYFSDEFQTSLKYSSKSDTNLRYMFVCDVALGKVYETENKLIELTQAPLDHHSVRALPGKFFKNSEFAIYNTNQQRLRYLVEFCNEGEEYNAGITSGQEIVPNPLATPFTQAESSPQFVEPDIRNLKDALNETKSGLLTSSGPDALSFKSLHVRGKLVDLACEVVVLQEYRNLLSSTIEAKYVFPLHEGAVVCGFEAFIGDKHLIARIEEKKKARKEYREAVEQGQGAYLMEEQTPMVFTVSVGNLPANCVILIKVTFVSELEYDGSSICFKLPHAVAPWVKDDALNDTKTQNTTSTHAISGKRLENSSLLLNVHVPYDIKKIYCPSHLVKTKSTATRATVQLCEDQVLDSTFELEISLASIHVPRLWVESCEELESQAAMLVFYPEFETGFEKNPEIIFIIDMSNSMQQLSGTVAKTALILCLEQLVQRQMNIYFNVIAFGTGAKELFIKSEKLNNATLKTTKLFVQNLSIDMGNSDVLPCLISSSLIYTCRNRNIILLSDGHLNNVPQLQTFCSKLSPNIRIFTFACNETANVHLLKSISSKTGGILEVLDLKRRREWIKKIDRQLDRCRSECVSGVRLEWMVDEETQMEIKQSPDQIHSVFNGERLIVMALIPNNLRQFLVTLHALVGNTHVSTTLSANDSCITQGQLLHRLTVRSLIRDWEDGSQCEDVLYSLITKRRNESNIIKLSGQYGILCSLTSFVAIENRSKDGYKQFETPAAERILMKEEGDLLPYMGWQHDPSYKAEVLKLQDIANKEKDLKYHDLVIENERSRDALCLHQEPPQQPRCTDMITEMGYISRPDRIIKEKCMLGQMDKESGAIFQSFRSRSSSKRARSRSNGSRFRSSSSLSSSSSSSVVRCFEEEENDDAIVPEVSMHQGQIRCGWDYDQQGPFAAKANTMQVSDLTERCHAQQNIHSGELNLDTLQNDNVLVCEQEEHKIMNQDTRARASGEVLKKLSPETVKPNEPLDIVHRQSLVLDTEMGSKLDDLGDEKSIRNKSEEKFRSMGPSLFQRHHMTSHDMNCAPPLPPPPPPPPQRILTKSASRIASPSIPFIQSKIVDSEMFRYLHPSPSRLRKPLKSLCNIKLKSLAQRSVEAFPLMDGLPVPMIGEQPVLDDLTGTPMMDKIPAPLIEEVPLPLKDKSVPLMDEVPGPTMYEPPEPMIYEAPAPIMGEIPVRMMDERPVHSPRSPVSHRAMAMSYPVGGGPCTHSSAMPVTTEQMQKRSFVKKKKVIIMTEPDKESEVSAELGTMANDLMGDEPLLLQDYNKPVLPLEARLPTPTFTVHPRKPFSHKPKSLRRSRSRRGIPEAIQYTVCNSVANGLILKLIVETIEGDIVKTTDSAIFKEYTDSKNIIAHLNLIGLPSLGEKAYNDTLLIVLCFVLLLRYYTTVESTTDISDLEWFKGAISLISTEMPNLAAWLKRLENGLELLLKRVNTTPYQLQLGRNWRDAAIELMKMD